MNNNDPDHIKEKLPYLRKRMEIKEKIRSFFLKQHYLEVETPYLVSTPGEEIHLHPFQTQYESYQGDTAKRFLHTSPEFAMKRIVAAIQQPIFQFARVWRNGEISPQHTPEFTMLEWYTPHQTLEEMMEQTEEIVKLSTPSHLTYHGKTLSMDGEFERMTVRQAFIKYAGVDIFSTDGDPQKLADMSGYHLREKESWDDLFFRIMLDKIEPHLGKNKPTFLTHWPRKMAALAKMDPNNPQQALRFELYCGGLELTNGFEELTDPKEQRQRFLEDRNTRKTLYKDRPQWPLDEKFLKALHTLPPCSGNALGFDRLVMLATQTSNIKDVQWL